MANFCLRPEFVDKFKKGLISREIDPQKLSQMTSTDRRTFLERYVGKDSAEQTNALFESKLLLKNQKAGYITWAKKVGGLSPQAKRDLISRIEKMDKILNPTEEKAFLHDLASQKLGVGISSQEAKTISDLSQKVQDTQKLQQPDLTFNTEDQRLAYGRAKVALGNYVNDLKNAPKGLTLNPIKIVKGLPGTTKSIRASMDDSAIFRQGWKTLMTHPLTWQRNARKTFSDAIKTFGGKKVMDEITADIISRPNYERMVKGKLAVSTIEEAFPSTLPEKIPLFGRAYKASETAYTGFVYRQRADIFDKYLQIAEKSGLNINDPKELKSIASMVNSLTGRGNFGRYEPAADLLNSVFFSPRNVKSHIDTLLHPFTGAGGSSFVRKQAAINLVKIISGTAGVLAVANAVRPGSVETDPRSADFGKIRVGNTRFDVTGGMSSLATLAARLATMSSKSSTTGQINPLNSGKFGSQTGTDVVVNFLENKLSPVGSVIKDITSGKDFNGNEITIPGELANLFVPLSVSTYEELKKDPNSAPTILAMIADGLGIATNTYGKTQKNWANNPTKTQEQFKTKVGDAKFKEANEKFNTQYDKWLQKTVSSSSYKKLSSDDQASLVTKAKSLIQAKILKGYGFTYVKKTKSQKDNTKRLLP